MYMSMKTPDQLICRSQMESITWQIEGAPLMKTLSHTIVCTITYQADLW